jgi:glycosyltransferase 2 family protein
MPAYNAWLTTMPSLLSRGSRTGSQPLVAARIACGFILSGALLWQILRLVPDWSAVGQAVSSIGVGTIVISGGILLIGGFFSLQSWVMVMSPGVHLSVPWARVFFVGQLGKYVPGSVWAGMMQASMGHRLGAQPRAMFSGFLVTFCVSLMCAALVALPAIDIWLPPRITLATRIAVVLGVLLLVGTPIGANLASRAMGNDLDRGQLLRAAVWACAGWVVAGAPVALLTYTFGAHAFSSLVVGISANAAAVAFGSLVVITPGGAGLREVVLLVALIPLLSPDRAAAVVLLTRLLTLFTDVLLAVWALLWRPTNRGGSP